MASSWKTIRVFLSSTFRDMQAERDHLVRFVFPLLREELVKYRIHFVDVDLRWGVAGLKHRRSPFPKLSTKMTMKLGLAGAAAKIGPQSKASKKTLATVQPAADAIRLVEVERKRNPESKAVDISLLKLGTGTGRKTTFPKSDRFQQLAGPRYGSHSGSFAKLQR